MGFTLSFSQVFYVGKYSLIVMVFTLVAAFGGGYLLGKLFKIIENLSIFFATNFNPYSISELLIINLWKNIPNIIAKTPADIKCIGIKSLMKFDTKAKITVIKIPKNFKYITLLKMNLSDNYITQTLSC